MPAGRGSSEWWTAITLASLFVIGRSLVFAVYEHAYFDSDQAIVGLMATHLAQGRAFPLFFYGQTYMLGVEAWLASPWILAFGSSVASLRASLILTNLVVSWLMIGFLYRACGLRPLLALAATAFFTLAPPFTAAQLVEAQGGNIEPFLYMVLLWWLRHRAWAFGVVLAVGVLNREFTFYAVPVLLVLELAWRRETWSAFAARWLTVAVAFVLVREVVQALLPVADLLGPGTRGDLVGGYAGSQLANLTGRMAFAPAELPARAWTWVSRDFSSMLGGVSVDGGVSTQGRAWIGWLSGAAGLAAALRVGQLAFSGRGRVAARQVGFAWYLLGTGLLSGLVYVASRPVDASVPRYFLLALLVPVGLSALWMALEPDVRVRRLAVVVVCIWAAGSIVDHARYVGAFVGGRVPNEMGEAAEALVEAGVPVARAGYWVAYELTFLTGERVRVASTDFVRISEYQRLADEAGTSAPLISDRPCAGGRPMGQWFLCASREGP